MTRGDRSKLVPNISVGPWNRKVRSIWCINRNFRNFRLNGKCLVTRTLRGNEKQVELQGFELSRVDFKIQFAMLKFDVWFYRIFRASYTRQTANCPSVVISRVREIFSVSTRRSWLRGKKDDRSRSIYLVFAPVNLLIHTIWAPGNEAKETYICKSITEIVNCTAFQSF